MNNTGIQMLLKAMGLDPQILIAKANELEVLAKALGAELQVRVQTIDQRLTRIEELLVLTAARVEASQGAVVPAGETAAVVPMEAKETRSHGRSTGHHEQARRARKAS